LKANKICHIIFTKEILCYDVKSLGINFEFGCSSVKHHKYYTKTGRSFFNQEGMLVSIDDKKIYQACKGVYQKHKEVYNKFLLLLGINNFPKDLFNLVYLYLKNLYLKNLQWEELKVKQITIYEDYQELIDSD